LECILKPRPRQLFKARQYLYGTTLLAAETFDPRSQPPGPRSRFYHLDPLGSTVNLTAGEDIPGGPAAGTVTAAYLYDAWGNYRELDITDPALPGDPLFDATPDLDPDGLYAWESYLANIQLAYDPTSLEPLASSLAAWNRLTYTGHEFDPETGLYYFKARFYDPELGRFASADPYLGDTLTPPSLHRYLYAYASPLRYVDLTGYYSVSAVGDDHLVVAVDRLDAARESQVAGSSVTGLLQWFEFEESAERRQFLAQLGALNPWMVTERGWAGREFRAGRKVILPSGYAFSAAGKQHLTDYLIAQHEANRSYGAKVGAAVGERVSEGAVMGLAWLAVTLGADPAGWADDAITIAGEFGKFLDERSIRQAAVTAGYTAAAVLPAASTRAVKAVEQAVDKALDAARRTAAEATQRLSSETIQQITTTADDIIKRLEKAQNSGAGKWVQKPRRGGPSLTHQSRMSGQPIQEVGGKQLINEYEVNGVFFDDFKNGKLIDYKDNYTKFIDKKTGNFLEWFQGAKELQNQAWNQVKAANGTPVVWKVGANQVDAFIKTVGDIPGLLIIP